MSNPTCPCGGATHKHDRTKAGTQRYRCTACGKVSTFTGARGRPLLGDRKLSQAERTRASRKRTGHDGNEARRRKRAEGEN